MCILRLQSPKTQLILKCFGTTTGQRQSTFEVWHRRAQMRAAGKCIRAASLVPWAMASRNLHNK